VFVLSGVLFLVEWAGTVAVLPVLDVALSGLAYTVSQGNITATIIWFAVTTGATAGLSHYKEKQ